MAAFPKKGIWQYLPNYKCPYILTQQSHFWECIWQIFPRIDQMLCSVQLLSCVWLFATHGLQHTRLPCPSPTPRACSNSCPLSRWCHPTISSSVFPFSSCLQSYPASGSFSMSQFFASGSQSIETSASNELMVQWLISFKNDWFDLLVVQGTLKSLLQHHSLKASIHDY